MVGGNKTQYPKQHRRSFNSIAIHITWNVSNLRCSGPFKEKASNQMMFGDRLVASPCPGAISFCTDPDDVLDLKT